MKTISQAQVCYWLKALSMDEMELFVHQILRELELVI